VKQFAPLLYRAAMLVRCECAQGDISAMTAAGGQEASHSTWVANKSCVAWRLWV